MTTREFTVNGKTVTVSEDYNQCDRCGSVQLWDTEMYWQDTMGDGVYHKHMKDYDAVCDDCFYELKKENKFISKLIRYMRRLNK